MYFNYKAILKDTFCIVNTLCIIFDYFVLFY